MEREGTCSLILTPTRCADRARPLLAQGRTGEAATVTAVASHTRLQRLGRLSLPLSAHYHYYVGPSFTVLHLTRFPGGLKAR